MSSLSSSFTLWPAGGGASVNNNQIHPSIFVQSTKHVDQRMIQNNVTSKETNQDTNKESRSPVETMDTVTRKIRVSPFEPLLHHRNMRNGTISPLLMSQYMQKQDIRSLSHDSQAKHAWGKHHIEPESTKCESCKRMLAFMEQNCHTKIQIDQQKVTFFNDHREQNLTAMDENITTKKSRCMGEKKSLFIREVDSFVTMDRKTIIDDDRAIDVLSDLSHDEESISPKSGPATPISLSERFYRSESFESRSEKETVPDEPPTQTKARASKILTMIVDAKTIPENSLLQLYAPTNACQMAKNQEKIHEMNKTCGEQSSNTALKSTQINFVDQNVNQEFLENHGGQATKIPLRTRLPSEITIPQELQWNIFRTSGNYKVEEALEKEKSQGSSVFQKSIDREFSNTFFQFDPVESDDFQDTSDEDSTHVTECYPRKLFQDMTASCSDTSFETTFDKNDLCYIQSTDNDGILMASEGKKEHRKQKLTETVCRDAHTICEEGSPNRNFKPNNAKSKNHIEIQEYLEEDTKSSHNKVSIQENLPLPASMKRQHSSMISGNASAIHDKNEHKMTNKKSREKGLDKIKKYIDLRADTNDKDGSKVRTKEKLEETSTDQSTNICLQRRIEANSTFPSDSPRATEYKTHFASSIRCGKQRSPIHRTSFYGKFSSNKRRRSQRIKNAKRENSLSNRVTRSQHVGGIFEVTLQGSDQKSNEAKATNLRL